MPTGVARGVSDNGRGPVGYRFRAHRNLARATGFSGGARATMRRGASEGEGAVSGQLERGDTQPHRLPRRAKTLPTIPCITDSGPRVTKNRSRGFFSGGDARRGPSLGLISPRSRSRFRQQEASSGGGAGAQESGLRENEYPRDSRDSRGSPVSPGFGGRPLPPPLRTRWHRTARPRGERPRRAERPPGAAPDPTCVRTGP